MSFSLFRVFLVNEVQKARKFSLSNEKRDVNCFELMRKQEKMREVKEEDIDRKRERRRERERGRQRERERERERERDEDTAKKTSSKEVMESIFIENDEGWGFKHRTPFKIIPFQLFPF